MIAKKKMHLKKQELYQGVSDDHDISRMPEYQFDSKVRMDLETATEKYFKASSITKNIEVRSTMSMH